MLWHTVQADIQLKKERQTSRFHIISTSYISCLTHSNTHLFSMHIYIQISHIRHAYFSKFKKSAFFHSLFSMNRWFPRTYSNLPNKHTGTITEFWEKTLIDVSRLFLASENYFNWLHWFLVLLRTERQESSQSIEMIFTAQKSSQNINQGFFS